MTKRIFVSQSELNLGRDRAHRKLEIKLDNQENRFEHQFTPNLDTGEEQDSVVSDSSFQNSSPVYCKYSDWCIVRKMNEKNCINYETCQTYKYYERYKELDINKLGIGI